MICFFTTHLHTVQAQPRKDLIVPKRYRRTSCPVAAEDPENGVRVLNESRMQRISCCKIFNC